MSFPEYSVYQCSDVGPISRLELNFVIYIIKKNIFIKVLKEAHSVKDDSEGAEYDDLTEANIGKMDNLFETES